MVNNRRRCLCDFDWSYYSLLDVKSEPNKANVEQLWRTRVHALYEFIFCLVKTHIKGEH